MDETDKKEIVAMMTRVSVAHVLGPLVEDLQRICDRMIQNDPMLAARLRQKGLIPYRNRWRDRMASPRYRDTPEGAAGAGGIA